MLDHIKISVTDIKTKEELLSLSEATKFQNLLNVEGDYFSRWKERNSYIEPGREDGTSIAFELSILIDLKLDKPKKDIAKKIVNVVCGFFEKENVLYISEQPQKGFVFFIFPLVGRKLNSLKYIQKGFLVKNIEFDIKMNILKGLDLSVDENQELKRKDNIITNFPVYEVLKEWKTEDCVDHFYNTNTPFDIVQTKMPRDELKALANTICSYFITGPERRISMNVIRGDATIEDLVNVLDNHLSTNHKELQDSDKKLIIEKVKTAVVGYDIVDYLIQDKSISDIRILASGHIRVKVRGKRFTSNLKFQDHDDYERFVTSLCERLGFNPKNRLIGRRTDLFSSKDFILRVNISAPLLNTSQNYIIQIRKTPKEKYSIEELMKFGMLDEDTARFLINKVKNGRNIIFIGKGGSGKTTIMNTLIEYIPYYCSGILIQETDELFSSNHPELYSQHVITDEADGSGEYGLSALTRNGLLTDLDYIIVSEIKGEEALYFLNAIDTGAKSMTSIHAGTAIEGVHKLADYIMYKGRYTKEETLYMLKCLDTIVFMHDFKVCEVVEVNGYNHEEKSLMFNEVYRREI